MFPKNLSKHESNKALLHDTTFFIMSTICNLRLYAYPSFYACCCTLFQACFFCIFYTFKYNFTKGLPHCVFVTCVHCTVYDTMQKYYVHTAYLCVEKKRRGHQCLYHRTLDLQTVALLTELSR